VSQLFKAMARANMSNSSFEWDFFLIHSHSDAPSAEKLQQLLGAECRVFLDRLAIPPGSVWPRALGKALRSSRVFVVLVSPNVAEALYALEEIQIAIGLTRKTPAAHRVVPVKLTPNQEDMTPYGLGVYQSLVMNSSGGMEAVAASLKAVLQSLLGGRTPAGTTPVSSAPPLKHPLRSYPRAALIPAEKITSSIVEAFASAIPPAQAQLAVVEANALRLEADPDDSEVTIIRTSFLPPPLNVPPFQYWLEALTQARMNGPRMLAALLERISSKKSSGLSPAAIRDRDALLSYLRSIPQ
jgi:hypothetical protein